MPRALLLFTCLLTLAWPSPTAAATWRRLRTPNFVFIGDASDSQIKGVARELEQFRAVLTLVLPNAAPVSPVPTVVAVFANDRTFQPYQPRYDGRRIELAGFFQPGEDVNYIAINGEFGGQAVRTVLHEYAHFLVGNTLGVLPIWLNEGLAEFYEATVESRGGRGAIIGSTPKAHLDVLQQSTLIPLSELMRVERNSSMYNEGSRRGVFYAQSWALTHYLSLGSPQRRQQFQDYLARVRQSGHSDELFRAVFGTEPTVIENELRQYVKRFSFPVIEVTFSQNISANITGRSEVIPEADAQGYLGDIVGRLGREEEARTLLEGAIAAAPTLARPVAAMGVLAMRASRVDEAITLLEKATEQLMPAEPAFFAALGRALVERANGQIGDTTARSVTLQRARTALERAAAGEPGTAQTSAVLGFVELALRQDLSKAVSLLTQAASLAPAREQYRLLLATALTATGDYEGATRHLGQLMARGSTPAVRDQARELLSQVAQLRSPAATGAPARTQP